MEVDSGNVEEVESEEQMEVESEEKLQANTECRDGKEKRWLKKKDKLLAKHTHIMNSMLRQRQLNGRTWWCKLCHKYCFNQPGFESHRASPSHQEQVRLLLSSKVKDLRDRFPDSKLTKPAIPS